MIPESYREDAPLRPASDDRHWLIRSQTLLREVEALINTGLTETAVRRMNKYWDRWQLACDIEPAPSAFSDSISNNT